MDECVEILETSPDALPSDKILCQWIKIQRLAEDIKFQFSMDDPSTNVAVNEPKIQYALKGFERELEEWRRETYKDNQSREYPSLHNSFRGCAILMNVQPVCFRASILHSFSAGSR